MPIAQERLIELAKAGEDLLNALGRVEEIVERETRLARENLITSGEALQNLEIMLTTEALVPGLNGIKLAIERERMRLTPARVKANAQRAAQRRHERAMRQDADNDGDFDP